MKKIIEKTIATVIITAGVSSFAYAGCQENWPILYNMTVEFNSDCISPGGASHSTCVDEFNNNITPFAYITGYSCGATTSEIDAMLDDLWEHYVNGWPYDPYNP